MSLTTFKKLLTALKNRHILTLAEIRNKFRLRGQHKSPKAMQHVTHHFQEVADHLKEQALTREDPERDSFARSAYNRYYYACFLSLRSAFCEINPKWEDAVHKDYPKILDGKIKDKLEYARKRAKNLKDPASVEIIQNASKAIPPLCEIITKAKLIRETADYDPDHQVHFNTFNKFSLNGVDVTQAQAWHRNVNTLIEALLAPWRKKICQ